MTWFSIALVVLGNVAYHLGQRAIPREAHPIVATLAAYLVALVTTVATMPLLARGVPLAPALRTLNGSTLLVGAGIVAIEIGFLLAYRSGWTLGNASLTANATLAVVLLCLGALFFREPLSLGRLSGVGLCLAGLWMVTRR